MTFFSQTPKGAGRTEVGNLVEQQFRVTRVGAAAQAAFAVLLSVDVDSSK
jgi:hypothetical protein